MSIRADVAALKQQLEQLFPGKWSYESKQQKNLATGIAEIDRLPKGVLARSQITEWEGNLSSGKTTCLRQIIINWCKAGLNVAYVDSENKLLAADWSFAGQDNQGRFWVVRNTGASSSADVWQKALWSCEQLLRSHSFDVVVLDSGNMPPIPSRTHARLLQSLSKSKAILIVMRDSTGASSNSWGSNSKFCFQWGQAPETIKGPAGTIMILPVVHLYVKKNGLTHISQITLSTSESHVTNCLFTHPPVPDRRTPKA